MPVQGATILPTNRSEAPREKKATNPLRASHVGTGTGTGRSWEAPWGVRRPKFRHPRLHSEVEVSECNALGGLALAARLMASLRVPQAIDGSLSLLSSHRSFHDSNHVLTHVCTSSCVGR